VQFNFDDLRLTQEEQHDLVNRILRSVQAEPWFVSFAEIVRRETEGHVQLLRFLLLDTWQFIRKANHVIDDKLTFALRFYLGSVGAPATISRAALRDQPLPPDQLFILQQLFRGKEIPAPPPIDRQVPIVADPHLPLRTLIRSVVLVVRANKLVDFATVLHRRALLRVMFPGRCSVLKTQDLNEFVCAAVGCLSIRVSYKIIRLRVRKSLVRRLRFSISFLQPRVYLNMWCHRKRRESFDPLKKSALQVRAPL